MKISSDIIKRIYLTMKRCRAFEERAMLEYQRGMPGNMHSSVGQEAIPAAVCAFLHQDDYMITSHRGHHDLISRGARMDKMFAELYARQTGYCEGMSGSMHISVPELGIMGAVGIVGSGLPFASGVSLACKLKGWNRVTVCFFGDGATTTGAFHEGIVFAAAFDLPVVFVCQNNQYEESTHWKYCSGGKLKNLAERALGYGIPGVSVDGNDAFAIAEAASAAIERARNGGGPTLIEGVTYRIYGHHMADPGGYRSSEEIEDWKKKDPIDRLFSYLLEKNLITEEENRQIETEIAQEVDEAVRFALESSENEPEDIPRYVYCNMT